MSAAHVYRRRVQFSETDMAGIVHFSNYYRYMEEAEHDWFRSLGLRIMQTLPDGRVVGWPRVRSACVYEAPARYDDDIEIRVYVARKGVKSLMLEFEFFRDSQRLARGSLKTVCCLCGPELQSIEIPPEYSDKIIESDPGSLPGVPR